MPAGSVGNRLGCSPFQPEVSTSLASIGVLTRDPGTEGGSTRMRRRYLWAGLVTLIAVTVAGSAAAMSNHSDAAQVLKMSIGAEPPSLDPGLATDTTSANVLFNLMDPLIRLGKPPGLKATPGAASSWSVKGKVVTLN